MLLWSSYPNPAKCWAAFEANTYLVDINERLAHCVMKKEKVHNAQNTESIAIKFEQKYMR